VRPDHEERRGTMSMTTEAEREQELDGPAGAHDGEGIGAFRPIHLAACLGAGVVVVLAINLIEWLG